MVSLLHLHRVMMVSGFDVLYVGTIVLQLPVLTLYCMVEPVGQPVGDGAVIVPTVGEHAGASQLLFVMVALLGVTDEKLKNFRIVSLVPTAQPKVSDLKNTERGLFVVPDA